MNILTKISRLFRPRLLVALFFLTALTLGSKYLWSVLPSSKPETIAQAQSSSPWVDSYGQLKQYYVSPGGAGNKSGSNAENAMAFATATTRTEQGVEYLLLPGTYGGAIVDQDLKVSGTKEKPIVFRSYSPYKAIFKGPWRIYGKYIWLVNNTFSDPTYPGKISKPAYSWDYSSNSALDIEAEGVHVINNYFYQLRRMQGMFVGNIGANQVVYGNIIHSFGVDAPFVVDVGSSNGVLQGFACRFANPHAIYTQNSYHSYGFKYFVANMFLGADEIIRSTELPPKAEIEKYCSNSANFVNLDPTGNFESRYQKLLTMRGSTSSGGSFSFHGYATNNLITGMYVKSNVFDGRFLLGSEKAPLFTKNSKGEDVPNYGSQPVSKNTVDGNYFHNSAVSIGYKKIAQVKFINNFAFGTKLEITKNWGVGEKVYVNNTSQNPVCPGGKCYYKDEPNVFTGNTIYTRNNASFMWFDTGAYTTPMSTNTITPQVRIDENDIWNNNVYGPIFGGNQGDRGWINGFPAWKEYTKSQGKEFDTNSTVKPLPTAPEIFVTPNEYQAQMANVVIYNFSSTGIGTDNTTVTIPLNKITPVIPQGKEYKIYRARELHGNPVAQGVLNGNITVPTDGEERSLFVIFGTNYPGSVPSSSTVIVPTPPPSSATPTPTPVPTPVPTPPAGSGSTQLPSGLVHHWAFDEGSGTAAKDSANNNNGVLQPGASWDTGIKGKALKLDGNGGHVILSNPYSPGNSAFTVTGWFKTTSTTPNGSIFSNVRKEGLYAQEGINITYKRMNHGNLSFDYKSAVAFANINVTDGQWHHFAAVKMSDGKTIKIYVDGNEISSRTLSGDSSLVNATNACIGKFCALSTSSNPFNGLLDEIKVYNKDLTVNEVRQDKDAATAVGGTTSSGVTPTPVPTPVPTPPAGSGSTQLPSGLVHHWAFDEGSGTAAKDSANNNNGVLQPGAAWDTGIKGKALKLDGNGGHVILSNPYSPGNSAFTVTGWFKTSSTTNTNAQIFSTLSKDGIYTDKGFHITYKRPNHGSLLFDYKGDTKKTALPNTKIEVGDGQWHHFAAVKMSDGRTTKLYLDGNEVATQVLPVAEPLNGMTHTCIGKLCAFSSSSSPFNGLIDEIKIYNKGLNASEVVQDRNHGTTLGVMTDEGIADTELATGESGAVGQEPLEFQESQESPAAPILPKEEESLWQRIINWFRNLF